MNRIISDVNFLSTNDDYGTAKYGVHTLSGRVRPSPGTYLGPPAAFVLVNSSDFLANSALRSKKEVTLIPAAFALSAGDIKEKVSNGGVIPGDGGVKSASPAREYYSSCHVEYLCCLRLYLPASLEQRCMVSPCAHDSIFFVLTSSRQRLCWWTSMCRVRPSDERRRDSTTLSDRFQDSCSRCLLSSPLQLL